MPLTSENIRTSLNPLRDDETGITRLEFLQVSAFITTLALAISRGFRMFPTGGAEGSIPTDPSGTGKKVVAKAVSHVTTNTSPESVVETVVENLRDKTAKWSERAMEERKNKEWGIQKGDEVKVKMGWRSRRFVYGITQGTVYYDTPPNKNDRKKLIKSPGQEIFPGTGSIARAIYSNQKCTVLKVVKEGKNTLLLSVPGQANCWVWASDFSVVKRQKK